MHRNIDENKISGKYGAPSFLLTIFLLLAQQNFGQTGTGSYSGIITYNGKSYNTKLYYDDSTSILAFGNYMTGTFIKDGHWVYFYKNGQPSKEIFFKRDMKRGLWIYYNQDGTILKTEKWHERDPLFEDTGLFEKTAGVVNGISSKSKKERRAQRQYENRAKNAYKRRAAD